MGLTSKERMQIVFDHKEPDRIPYQVTFAPEMDSLLRKKYSGKIKNIKSSNEEKFLGMSKLDILFEHDVLLLSYGIITGNHKSIDSDIYTDIWGITYKKIPFETINGYGYYTEIVDFPLADDKKIENYIPPNPDDENMEYAEELIKYYGNDYYFCGLIICSTYEGFKYLRGFTQSLIDLVANKDIAHKIMNMVADYHIKIGLKLIDRGVDMLWLADDLGTNKSLLMSPKTFREMIKPKLGYMITELRKRKKEIKIAFHSDGYIEPLMDDLIEVGIDILNPIQPECNDPAHLKKRYGDRLSFWGTISTQETLPFGSSSDIEKEVKERIKTCAPGGGFLLSPTQVVQLDVPVENIETLYNSIKKYGAYPIKI